jgi:hypothetical protein
MKRGLERIEATLSQLNTPNDAAQPLPAPRSETYSFRVSTPKPQPRSLPAEKPPETVQPFPVQDQCPKTPALPKFKLPSFSNHRHAANPNLAIGLLREIEEVVVRWQTELQQVMLQIQAVYLEGPIVDGWLESHPYTSAQHIGTSIATGTLRYAEIDQLMEYVQQLCDDQPQAAPDETTRTGYRLCGLDTDGQMWCRPCPTEQLPYVSLAIARYQKLRQLLARKQVLETRLSQLAKNLVNLHSNLQE